MRQTRHPYSKPDQQGKFDGLCGVYAILNSIKWLYRLGEDDLDAMFQSLCETLPDKFPQALWDGLGVPEISRLLKFSVAHVAEQYGHDDLHWPFDKNSGQSTHFGDVSGNKFRLMPQL
jgi:hypothetical protein